MIFSAYLGDAQGAAGWADGVSAHAAWLGLAPRTASVDLLPGHVFAYAWLEPGGSPSDPVVSRSPERLRLRTTGRGLGENAVSLDITLPAGELTILVPPATPEHFYTAGRSGSHVVGNDLRLMMRWAGHELDPRGVFSILRFNASLPPFTVARNVSRIPWGHAARLAPGTGEPSLKAACGDLIDPRRAGSVASPAEELLSRLDATLAVTPRDAVIFFSGGVDSALLAARLAASGRTDVTLLNLALSPNDPEAEHARRVAARLGLRFDQVTLAAPGVTRTLERLGRDYSFPFGDPSTIPTHVLVGGALRGGAPSAVLEGTGADGAHGVGVKLAQWSTLYAIPRFLREGVGAAYERAGLWKTGGRASWVTRIMRRSAAVPLHVAAILGRNALDGIAYSVPAPIRDEIDAGADRFVYALSAGFDPRERLSLLDVMTVCAERFATKSFDPLRHGGTPAIYPFLEPAMVGIGASLTWEQKAEGGKRKRLLKALLAKMLPQDLVYRKKSGFDPPFAETFGSGPVREHLNDVVLAADNPLQGYLHRDVVAGMVRRLEGGATLDAETYEFLWTLSMASGWLRSLKNSAVAEA